MIAKIILQKKPLMAHMLTGTAFDRFELVQCQITTFCSYQIDGTRRADFYEEGEAKPETSYALWGEVRPHALAVIRGKKTPLSFQFVFRLAEKDLPALLKRAGSGIAEADVYGLYINFNFDGKTLIVTTGTSLRGFTPDRSLEHFWDETVLRFFEKNGIELTDPE